MSAGDVNPWKPPVTKVNIWMGDRLNIADASYELTYSVIGKKQKPKNSPWKITSYGEPVLTPDGGERFDIIEVGG